MRNDALEAAPLKVYGLAAHQPKGVGMKRLIVLCAVALAGCSYRVDIASRDGATVGSGIAKKDGSGTGTINLDVGLRKYVGRWNVGSGGAAGLGITPGSATPTTIFAGSSGYTGNIMMRAADGGYMRCDFSFSDWTRTGTGACQDREGATYDMQIR